MSLPIRFRARAVHAKSKARRGNCARALLAWLAIGGCVRDAERPSDSTALYEVQGGNPNTVALLPDSTRLTASALLDAYLEASREGSRTHSALDTLAACEGATSTMLPSSLLAAWVLLPFEMRGDTVVARAQVTTVAEQDIDRRGGGFVARIRVRNDVLEWDVYRTPEGRMVVCNGLRFGYVGSDSLTTWRPDGASYASARQIADSIYMARKQ